MQCKGGGTARKCSNNQALGHHGFFFLADGFASASNVLLRGAGEVAAAKAGLVSGARAGGELPAPISQDFVQLGRFPSNVATAEAGPPRDPRGPCRRLPGSGGRTRPVAC